MAQDRFQLYVEGDSLVTAGDYNGALGISKILIESDSLEFQSFGFMLIGQAYNAQDKDSIALTFYNTSISVFKSNAPAYQLKGNLFYDNGELDSAVNNYLKAIDNLTDTYSPAFISHLFSETAQALREIADYERAIIALNVSLAYDSLFWYDYFQLGDVYLMTDSLDKAIQYSELAIERDKSNSGGPFYVKAAALYLKGELDEALKLTEIALKDSAFLYRTNFLIADIYANNGNKPLALEYLDVCLKIYPNDVSTLNNIAFINMQTGAYKEAIVYFDKCIALSPDFPFPYNNKAWCLYQMGLHQEALTSCDKSLELDDTNSYAYANKAKILFALSMTNSACKDVLKAEELGYPDLEDLNILKEKCRK